MELSVGQQVVVCINGGVVPPALKQRAQHDKTKSLASIKAMQVFSVKYKGKGRASSLPK